MNFTTIKEMIYVIDKKMVKDEEISTFKKVRSNLTKLNNFVQKRFGQLQVSGITTPALKVKRQHKKNVTVVYDEKEVA